MSLYFTSIPFCKHRWQAINCSRGNPSVIWWFDCIASFTDLLIDEVIFARYSENFCTRTVSGDLFQFV